MRTKEEFEDDFQEKIVSTVEDIYAVETAEMIEYFSKKLDEYAKAYAQEKFEKAKVEKKNTYGDYEADGWNDCREEIIKRWNEQ